MALSNESLGGGDHLTYDVVITSRNLTVKWAESVAGIELTSPGSVSSVLTTGPPRLNLISNNFACNETNFAGNFNEL